MLLLVLPLEKKFGPRSGKTVLNFSSNPNLIGPTDLPWLAATTEVKQTKQYHIQAAVDPFNWSEFCLNQTIISSFLKLDGSALKFVKQCQLEAFSDDIYRLR
jgi:hypothetical protein